MRVFTTDHHEVRLPPRHRFPMEKYRLLRERLLERDVLRPAWLERAPLAPLEAILEVHAAEYVHAFLEDRLDRERSKRIGFPWSEALVG
ncbi:MAG: histone deacetylase, partial [Planctomycetota bacterium]